MYPGRMMKSLYVKPCPSDINCDPVIPSSGTYEFPPHMRCSAMFSLLLQDGIRDMI